MQMNRIDSIKELRTLMRYGGRANVEVFVAAEEGELEKLKLLLEKGAEWANGKHWDGWAPLHNMNALQHYLASVGIQATVRENGAAELAARRETLKLVTGIVFIGGSLEAVRIQHDHRGTMGRLANSTQAYFRNSIPVEVCGDKPRRVVSDVSGVPILSQRQTGADIQKADLAWVIGHMTG